MFDIDKNDGTLHLTRGDVCYFGVSAQDDATKENFIFQPGDIVRFKVYGKKNCKKVVLEKDFLVETPAEEVWIYLEKEDTTIGDIINRATTYWYEVELNPDVKPETIIGNSKKGAKLLILYPEGATIPKTGEEIKPEDVPVVDKELDAMSERPIANSAVARAILALYKEIKLLKNVTQEGENV